MMDWEKVVVALDGFSKSYTSEAEEYIDRGKNRQAALFMTSVLVVDALRAALRYGLKSAQEGQSPDAGQPDHET